MSFPGRQAKVMVRDAYVDFWKGRLKSARTKLHEALALKKDVEAYSGSEWQQNHHDFTTAMLDMSVLWYKLGNFKEGDSLASRAQAWADDPNCSSQLNFERSFDVRKKRILHFISGLGGWIRSAIPM